MLPNTVHSRAWIVFAYASFLAALGMVALGIGLMPAGLTLKAYMAIGMLMLVQSCITLTKTLRDAYESNRLLARLDDARTEELLAKSASPQA